MRAARPAYQSLVGALEHVTDEMKAAAPRGLPADEPEVVHVSDTLSEAGEREEVELNPREASLPGRHLQISTVPCERAPSSCYFR